MDLRRGNEKAITYITIVKRYCWSSVSIFHWTFIPMDYDLFHWHTAFSDKNNISCYQDTYETSSPNTHTEQVCTFIKCPQIHRLICKASCQVLYLVNPVWDTMRSHFPPHQHHCNKAECKSNVQEWKGVNCSSNEERGNANVWDCKCCGLPLRRKQHLNWDWGDYVNAYNICKTEEKQHI